MKEHSEFGVCIHHNENTFEHFECESFEEALECFSINAGKVYCIDLNRYSKTGRVVETFRTEYAKDNHKRRFMSMKTLKEKLNNVIKKHPMLTGIIFGVVVLLLLLYFAICLSFDKVVNPIDLFNGSLTQQDAGIIVTSEDAEVFDGTATDAITAGTIKALDVILDAKNSTEELTEESTEENVVAEGTFEVPIQNTNGTYYIKSSLQSYKDDSEIPEYAIELPKGYLEEYVDEYSTNFIKSFPDDIGFEVTDEYGNTYSAEYIYVNTNATRNTPYVEAVDYIKAQMMNYMYNDIFELEVDDINYIIAYSAINQEEYAEEIPEYFPKTSICCMTVLDDNVSCESGCCTYTEVMEVYADTYEMFESNEQVSEYVTNLIKGLSIKLVRG